ncbi:MAG: hypothetical protein WDM88_09055 [Galbitalea sp.]
MPSSRRRVYLRRRIAVLTAALVALALLFYLPLTLLAPLHAVEPRHTVYSAPMTASTTLDLPGYGASAIAAIGYPGLLASGGSSAPLPIASITKIITALVVLQSKPLTPGEQGPSIPFTAADQAILKSYAARDGDVYPIQVGGSMSELDVLTVALVASANNYARALADWAFGSEANFLPVANAWLKTNGMTLDDIDRLDRAQLPEHQHPERPHHARQARPGESGGLHARRHQDDDHARRRNHQEHQRAARQGGHRRHQDGDPRTVVPAVLESARAGRPRRHPDRCRSRRSRPSDDRRRHPHAREDRASGLPPRHPREEGSEFRELPDDLGCVRQCRHDPVGLRRGLGRHEGHLQHRRTTDRAGSEGRDHRFGQLHGGSAKTHGCRSGCREP